jgi:hypothetical protein
LTFLPNKQRQQRRKRRVRAAGPRQPRNGKGEGANGGGPEKRILAAATVTLDRKCTSVKEADVPQRQSTEVHSMLVICLSMLS